MNKIMEKGKVKGSILFTVITVMMVLVVFLMSTLVLTSSANRRSYYTYFETQAQYAAQAALDAVTNSAYTDGEFHEWVVKASKEYHDNTSDTKEKPKVTVNFDGTDIQFSDNVNAVTCEVELADEMLVWDELTGAVHKTPAYKVTATASVGTGKNRSDYTVVNYIYENYRVPDSDKIPTVNNSAVNRLYKYNKSGSGGDNSSILPGSPKAVFSFGKSATSNNMQYFGPQYSGMSNLPAGRGLYDGIAQDDKQFFTALSNNSHSVGNAVFVSNVKSRVSSNYIFQNYGEHAIFYGNLYPAQPHQGFFFKADISEGTRATGGVDYTKTPYVYVDGVIDTSDNNGSVLIGYDDKKEEGTTNINLYCGGVKVGETGDGSLIVRGDVFMYDPSLNSYWGGAEEAGKTRLGYFVDNNVGRMNAPWGISSAGGNIFCNNAKLTLAKDMYIPGDLVFTNNAGELVIGANVSVGGKVLCAGKLTVTGNLDCATIVTTTSATVDGVNYNLDSVTDPNLQGYKIDMDGDGTPDTFNYSAFLYDKYADKDGYGPYLNTADNEINNTYDGEWDAYLSRGYQQALMPYNMRIEEIIGTYYRWDLKSTDRSVVEERIEKDTLIAESKQAGHNYGIKAFDCGGYVATMENPEDWNPQTKYNNDAQNFMNNVPEGATIIEDINGVWNEDPDAPDGHYWRKVVYNEKAIRYSDPVWVENMMYVPYTTSRNTVTLSDGTTKKTSFMPVYEPIANEQAVMAAVGDTAYTDLASFASGIDKKYSCDAKPGYTMLSDAGLIRTDIQVGYHDTSSGAFTKLPGDRLSNAFVIKESCYIDLNESVTKGFTNFFVDPEGHDATDPIKIVISGNKQCAAMFVINNTAYYSTDYKTCEKGYAEMTPPRIAPKGAVQFFFEDGFYPTNLFQIHNSGLFPYSHLTGGYADATGNFHIVSNPLYPIDDKGNINEQWTKLDNDIKYSYEYVPTSIVYGQAGAVYNSQNGEILHANVVMPKSTFNATNANQYKPIVAYQEYWYSSVYSLEGTPTDQLCPCFGIGSVVCEDITTGSNIASVVYIGDENISPEIILNGIPTVSNYRHKIGTENGEYFSNDHIGAS